MIKLKKTSSWIIIATFILIVIFISGKYSSKKENNDHEKDLTDNNVYSKSIEVGNTKLDLVVKKCSIW